MKVSEMIKFLETLPQDAELDIRIPVTFYELGDYTIIARDVDCNETKINGDKVSILFYN